MRSLVSFLYCQNVSVGVQLWDNKADAAVQRWVFFPSHSLSLSLSEAIWTLSVAARGPVFCVWTGLLIWKYVCECACGAWMLVSSSTVECARHGAVMQTHSCVMTSSPLSLLSCHDVNDGNSARTLRLCSCFFFVVVLFYQHGQGVVYPVYVNCCHTKKSHINSKRHNKLIFVKWQDF